MNTQHSATTIERAWITAESSDVCRPWPGQQVKQTTVATCLEEMVTNYAAHKVTPCPGAWHTGFGPLAGDHPSATPCLKSGIGNWRLACARKRSPCRQYRGVYPPAMIAPFQVARRVLELDPQSPGLAGEPGERYTAPPSTASPAGGSHTGLRVKPP